VGQILSPTLKLHPSISRFILILLIGLIARRSGFAQSQRPILDPRAASSVTTAADFYVAPEGDDSWPGTESQPFRTVDRARLAVQALKSQVSGRTITVFIRGGTYFLPSTWTFTSLDSGTATTPILYANYPGESPVISAGQLLTNWVKNSSGQWQTILPSGTYFTQMWVNGTRRYPARTTAKGYLYISGGYSTTGSKTTANQLAYDVPPVGGVPSTMTNLADVDLILFEAWNVSHMRISSVNTTTRRITTTKSLTQSANFGFIPGHHFLLANVKEALKQPGQFYLDRPTGALIYIPQDNEVLSSATIIAPLLQQVLRASQLSYVTFQGLTFSHTDWPIPPDGYVGKQADSATPAAISLRDSTGAVFEGDIIAHTGAYGIEFQGSGSPGGASPYLASFQDGLIYDTGAGGIRIGDRVTTCNTDPTVPQSIYVGNNLITGGGRVLAGSYGISVGDAHHILVEHNEVSDFYNNGIAVGFNWDYSCNFAHDDIVQFNYLHNLGQGVTSDMGGVYFLSGLNTGNEILNNKVHDVNHDPAGYGGWGIYTDQGAMGVLVQNNLVYRTTDASLHVNSSPIPPPTPTAPNLFKNNILVYGGMGAMSRHNDTTFLSFEFENNVFSYDKQTIQYGYWYCQGKAVCTDYFQLDNNLYFDNTVKGGIPGKPFFKTAYAAVNSIEQPKITWLSWGQWQALGEDVHSLFADPLFVNPTTDDYTLSPTSPAFSLGFVAFDPTQAGRFPTATLQAPPITAAYPTLLTGVFVVSPSVGATYSNPVEFVAYGTGASPITSMQIAVDGVSKYRMSSSSLRTSLTLRAGKRNVVVQATDSKGNIYKRAETITVN
jgi:Right handed beta helix region